MVTVLKGLHVEPLVAEPVSQTLIKEETETAVSLVVETPRSSGEVPENDPGVLNGYYFSSRHESSFLFGGVHEPLEIGVPLNGGNSVLTEPVGICCVDIVDRQTEIVERLPLHPSEALSPRYGSEQVECGILDCASWRDGFELLPIINELYLYGPEMKNLYDALVDKYPAENLHYYPQDQMNHMIDD